MTRKDDAGMTTLPDESTERIASTDTADGPSGANGWPPLTYSTEELLREHDGLTPHVVLGRRLHGGFHPDGTYEPPRALGRERALDAWTAALRTRGGAPLVADSGLLAGVRLPNVEQQRVLLRHGIDRPFWNTLTVTGKLEARGRLLAELPVPDLRPAIVEDVSEMAIGHLGTGLLLAHGLDEGGVPSDDVGGHDAMWFLARDLVFGVAAHDDVEPPANIARPEAGRRFMPEVPAEIEALLSLLANVLLIELRAELGFAETQAILRTPDLFADRRDEAELAAEIVERIRTDEGIHVRSLCLYLGELRAVTLRTVEGGTIPGRDVIDRFWDGLVRWATVDQPRLTADRIRPQLEAEVRARPDADRVLAELDRVGPPITGGA
jgi:hypothetical protein